MRLGHRFDFDIGGHRHNKYYYLLFYYFIILYILYYTTLKFYDIYAFMIDF